MAIQYINTGSSANAGNGDSLRSAFIKVNNNFAYLSTASFGGGSNGYTGSRGDAGFVGSRGNNGFTGSAGQGIVQPGVPGQLAFYTSTGSVVSHASGITYSTVTQTLVIGDSTYSSTNVFWVRESYSAVQPRGWVFTQHHSNSDVVNFTWNRTRGTFANPAPVITNDDIADLVFTTQVGATPIDIAAITVSVETTSTTYPAGKFMFFVSSGTTTSSSLVSELSSTGTFKFTKIGALVTGTNLIVESSLVPDQDSVRSLGSSANQWHSLYVSSSTVYINRTPVTIDNAGTLLVNGSSILGTPGYTGSRGNLGYTGSKGDTGSQGNQGAIGYTGSRGNLGYTGSRGVDGYAGSQGDIGYTGSEGAPGQQGNRGYTGSEGLQGTPGLQGLTGAQGINIVLVGSTTTVTTSTVGLGTAGQGWINTTDGDVYFWNTGTQLWENIGPIVGPQGDLGYTGSQGGQGDIGLTGDPGYTGSQGDVGYVGSQGDVGYTGSQGDLGYTGSQGDLGYVGSQGDIGYSGSQGELGYVGSQGDVGYTGSTGGRGFQGYTGSEGFVGSQGNLGFTGSRGLTGFTGSRGLTGFTGSEGYTGSKGEPGEAGGNANTGNFVFTASQVSVSNDGDITLVTNANTWTFSTDGNLTFPQGTLLGYSDPGGFIIDGAVDKDIAIYTYSGADAHGWTFGTDGTLTAPGHILPSTNLAYDLGSTTTQWRSIYVGTGTIYIGGVALGVNADNYVTVDGNPIITVDTASNLTIPGETDLSIVVGGGSLGNVEVAEVDELVPPGGVWRLFISDEEYPTLGTTVQIGDTVTTSWGTPITATITDIVQDSGDWQIHVEQDITAGFNGYDTVTFSSVSGKTWRFDTDGVITLPGGNTRIGNTNGNDNIVANTGTSFGVISQGQGGYVGLQWIDNPENIGTTLTQVAAVIVNSPIASTSGTVQIVTGITTGTSIGNNTWEFGADGSLTIPDDIQDANGSVVRVATTSTAPTRVNGQLWFDNQEGRLYIKNDGVWLDASPTQIPSPETYLDGLAIDGTVIGTANVNGDAIVIDGGDNTKLTVSNNSVTIQVPGTLTRQYWAAEFGGITTAVTTSSLTVGTGAFYDSQGNVYVLGGVQFDTNEGSGLDSLLLKYDTNGNLLWSRTWHDDSGANCGAINQAFAIDSNDRIYWLATAAVPGFGCWTGYMDTEGNLGLGGVAQASLGFLDGNFAGADIACDNSGNYYLAGFYNDGNEIPAVIKVDGDSGVPIWTGSIVPEDFESLPSEGVYRAVTVNPTTGDVWAIGDYNDGGLRAMLSKWDINGTHQWTKELVTVTGDVAAAVIYNGGYVYTIVNDDPDQKAVVSKFDTDGVLIWASFLAVGALDPLPNNFGDYNTGAYDLSFDAVGNVYVTGTIPGPPVGQPQLWITKLDPVTGEMLYSRMLATNAGTVIFDQGGFGSGISGHRVGDIYQDTIVVTAVTESDIDDNTGTNALRVIVAQLPIDGSVTGTFDNINITNITSDIDSICSTGTYTVTTLVWSTGTSTAITSTSSISVSTVTDVVGLTGETIVLGSGTAGGTTTTNTWTFVNNNIILPIGGDILDSNGNSVLGATTSTHIEYTDGQSGYTSTVDLGYNFEVDVDDAHLNLNGVGTWSIGSNNFDTKIFSTDDPGNEPRVIVVRADDEDWTFGPLGLLTLPYGGVISEVGGAFGGAIRLEPSGASSATQALVIYPTAGVDGNHIHLTAGYGGETDLYLGSDIQYVKVDHSGAIVVGAVGANTSTWTFGTDGVLTLSTASVILGNSTDPNVYIETATTSTTNTWTFAADGSTTLPIGVSIDESNGSHFPRIVADTGKAFSIQGYGSTGSVALQWAETASTSSQIAQVGLNKFGDDLAKVVLTAGTSTNDMKIWKFAADGGLTFPDNTVQTTAYKTGQTTVELSTLTEVMSAGYEITSLEGINVIYFTTASGYTDVATHLGAIPLPEYPGQRVTIINDANSTVTVAWTVLAQSVSITLDNYDSSDLIAITHPKYGGLAWWETSRYNW